MKRGLITWDKAEIPPAVFDHRVGRARIVLEERNLPALVVYSELWRSNQARFFSNYMPYFNRALLIIPRDFAPTLLCGLSPRVYGWIRSVTTLEDVRPAGNFSKPLMEIANERGWTRLGVLALDEFPYDIYKNIHSGSLDLVNVSPADVCRLGEDQTELTLRRKASMLSEQVLTEEIPNGVGSIDHHFVGRLERRLRKEGAEDLIILVTNGDSVPAPPQGAKLQENFSVSVALEYRGHWVRLSRPHGTDEVLRACRYQWNSRTRGHGACSEILDGSYPYEWGEGNISATHIEYDLHGKRLFYGETIL